MNGRKLNKVCQGQIWWAFLQNKKEGDDIMGTEYKVIGKFLSPSKISGEMEKMVVVQDARGACVMPEDEWKWVYGRQHRDRWKKNDSAAQQLKKGLFPMDIERTKQIISTELLSMSDQGLADVIRGILFSENNQIDWLEAGQIISKYMPEVELEGEEI